MVQNILGQKIMIHIFVHTLSSSVSNLRVTWSSIIASTPALTKLRQSDSSNSRFSVSKDLLLGKFCKKIIVDTILRIFL
jgi:hypothetical protein